MNDTLDPDDELLAEFIAETREGLVSGEALLVELEQDPENKESLEALFRTLHTIKGTAGYFELHRLKHLAHQLENLLDLLRSGAVVLNAQLTEQLLVGVDMIGEIVAATENGDSDPGDPERIEELLAQIEVAKSAELDASAEARYAQLLESIAQLRSAVIQDEGVEACLETVFQLEASISAQLLADSEHQDAEDDAQASTPEASPRQEAATSPGDPSAEEGALHPATRSKKTPSKVEKTMRVPERRVDDFLSYVGSLVRLRQVIVGVERQITQSVQNPTLLNEVRSMAGSFIKVSEELQRSVMSLRQVSINTIMRKVPRLVRDVAVARDKKIEVQLIGEHTEIDKSLVEVLEGPIVHMVRNGADHGIESPQDRLAVGKNEVGTVTVEVVDEAEELLVWIRDDGAGIKRAKLRAKAIATGVIGPDDELTDEDLVKLIFSPGMSTADTITDISGRGVGMDVVRRNIESRGGRVTITTVEGQGSEFCVAVPKAVATVITPAITVRIQGRIFTVPMADVVEVVKFSGPQLKDLEATPGGWVLHLRDQVIPMLSLQELLGLGSEDPHHEADIIIVDTGYGPLGLRVNEVLDTLDIVIQELDYLAPRYGIFAEACILGDGRIALVLDAEVVAKCFRPNQEVEARTHHAQTAGLMAANKTPSDAPPPQSLLVYEVEPGHLQVVNMSSVLRLETLPQHAIEYSGAHLCTKYRGGLLHLSDPPNSQSPRLEAQPVVVLTHHNRHIGLLVHRIVDVIETSVDAFYPAQFDGIQDTVLIGEQMRERLDVAALFSRYFKVPDEAPAEGAADLPLAA